MGCRIENRYGFDDGSVGAFEGTAKVSSSNTVGNSEIVIVRATLSLETVGTNTSDKICDDIIPLNQKIIYSLPAFTKISCLIILK